MGKAAPAKAVKKEPCKAKAKAKAKPSPKASPKSQASPKRAPRTATVKVEPAADPAAAGQLTVDRSTLSGLLTSLSYQTKAKKATPEHKAQASKILAGLN